jgi:SecD/SecF fusion protein
MESASTSVFEQITQLLIAAFVAIGSLLGVFEPAAKPAYEVTFRIDGPKIAETEQVIKQRLREADFSDVIVKADGSGTLRVLAPRDVDMPALKTTVLQKGALEFVLAFPEGEKAAPPPDARRLKNRESGTEVPVQSVEGLSGKVIASASAGFDPMSGQPVVNFTFTEEAGKQFGLLTAANIGRTFAIVLDDEILSMPRINTAIPGGSGLISGNLTIEDTKSLANVLNIGPLPESVELVSVLELAKP